MASVWGIDIGKAALKAVKLRRTKEGLEIQAIEYLPYPIEDDEDERQEHVNDAIRSFLTKHKLGSDAIVVGIPGLHAFSRFISLPPVDKGKIAMMVRMEAQQQIPFPIDEVNWDWVKIEREYMAGEEVEVGIFATRSELIDGFLGDLDEHNLNPDIVTIAPLAVYNFVRHNIGDRDGSTIILDIGAEHTDLIIIDGERFWIRNLRIAGNDITKALAERFKIPFAEAEKLKKSASKSPQARKIFSAMEGVLKDLVGEIHRSVGFFKSQADDLDVQRMLLLGDGSKLKNLSKFLKEQLGYSVKRVSKLEQESFPIHDDVDVDLLKSHVMGFAVALGLAMQGAEASLCKINLAPESLIIQSTLKQKIPWAIGALVCSWLACGLSYTYWEGNRDKVTKTLKSISQLKKFEAAERGAKELADFSKEIKEAEELAALGEGRLLVAQFLKELAQVLPTDNADLRPLGVDDEVRSKDLSKQIDHVLTKDEQRKKNDKRLWLLECDITPIPESPTGHRVNLQVARRYNRGGTDPGQVRDDIKTQVSSLKNKLLGEPFWLRTGPSLSEYGDLNVTPPEILYFLHPQATQDPGRNTFEVVSVNLSFEIGVPKPVEKQPEEQEGGN